MSRKVVPGDLIVIPGNLPHWWSSLDSDIRYLIFRPDPEGLQAARQALMRLDECLAKLRELAGAANAAPDPTLIAQFAEKLDDDLNISGAWGVIFEWVRHMNSAAAKP